MDLAAFASEILQDTFEGSCPDGSYLQSLGVKHGLLIQTEYDPNKHGESGIELDPGDDWYEYSPEFKAALDGTSIKTGE